MKVEELKMEEYRQILHYFRLLDVMLNQVINDDKFLTKEFDTYTDVIVGKPFAELSLKKLSNNTVRLTINGDKKLNKASMHSIFNYSRTSISLLSAIERVYDDISHDATYTL